MIFIALLLAINFILLSAIFTAIAHVHEHQQYLEEQLEVKAKG